MARVSARIKIPAARRRKPEQGLHLVVARFLDMALPDDATWFHPPNGGARNVVEAAILKRMGTRPGVPDCVIIHRQRAYGVELKTEKSYLSRAQKLTHEALARAGMKIAVCRSLDEVQSALDGWGIESRARTFGFAA